jgi:ankyrin repeat protein
MLRTSISEKKSSEKKPPDPVLETAAYLAHVTGIPQLSDEQFKNETLFKAIEHRNIKNIKLYFTTGALKSSPANFPIKGELDPLCWAVMQKANINAQLLFQFNANSGSTRKNVSTFYAIQALSNTDSDIIRLLLQLGVDPNSRGKNYSALSFAVWRGLSDVVKLLLEYKPSLQEHTLHINLFKKIKHEPILFQALHAAVNAPENQHADFKKIIIFLLNANANPCEIINEACITEEFQIEEPISPLTVVCLSATRNTKELIILLLAAGATPDNTYTFFGRNPEIENKVTADSKKENEHKHHEESDEEDDEDELERNLDENIQYLKMLEKTAKQRNVSLRTLAWQMLNPTLSKTVSSTQPKEESSMSSKSTEENIPTMVMPKLLSSLPINLQSKLFLANTIGVANSDEEFKEEQYNKIFQAIEENNLAEVNFYIREKTLLEQTSAGKYSKKSKGHTALSWATTCKKPPIVRAILNAKANPNSGPFYRASALSVAAKTGDLEILDSLLEYKANPNTQDQYFIAPLLSTVLYSAAANHEEKNVNVPGVLKRLLEAKANADEQYKCGAIFAMFSQSAKEGEILSALTLLCFLALPQKEMLTLMLLAAGATTQPVHQLLAERQKASIPNDTMPTTESKESKKEDSEMTSPVSDDDSPFLSFERHNEIEAVMGFRFMTKKPNESEKLFAEHLTFIKTLEQEASKREDHSLQNLAREKLEKTYNMRLFSTAKKEEKLESTLTETKSSKASISDQQKLSALLSESLENYKHRISHIEFYEVSPSDSLNQEICLVPLKNNDLGDLRELLCNTIPEKIWGKQFDSYSYSPRDGELSISICVAERYSSKEESNIRKERFKMFYEELNKLINPAQENIHQPKR